METVKHQHRVDAHDDDGAESTSHESVRSARGKGKMERSNSARDEARDAAAPPRKKTRVAQVEESGKGKRKASTNTTRATWTSESVDAALSIHKAVGSWQLVCEPFKELAIANGWGSEHTRYTKTSVYQGVSKFLHRKVKDSDESTEYDSKDEGEECSEVIASKDEWTEDEDAEGTEETEEAEEAGLDAQLDHDGELDSGSTDQVAFEPATSEATATVRQLSLSGDLRGMGIKDEASPTSPAPSGEPAGISVRQQRAQPVAVSPEEAIRARAVVDLTAESDDELPIGESSAQGGGGLESAPPLPELRSAQTAAAHEEEGADSAGSIDGDEMLQLIVSVYHQISREIVGLESEMAAIRSQMQSALLANPAERIQVEELKAQLVALSVQFANQKRKRSVIVARIAMLRRSSTALDALLQRLSFDVAVVQQGCHERCASLGNSISQKREDIEKVKREIRVASCSSESDEPSSLIMFDLIKKLATEERSLQQLEEQLLREFDKLLEYSNRIRVETWKMKRLGVVAVESRADS